MLFKMYQTSSSSFAPRPPPHPHFTFVVYNTNVCVTSHIYLPCELICFQFSSWNWVNFVSALLVDDVPAVDSSIGQLRYLLGDAPPVHEVGLYTIFSVPVFFCTSGYSFPQSISLPFLPLDLSSCYTCLLDMAFDHPHVPFVNSIGRLLSPSSLVVFD